VVSHGHANVAPNPAVTLRQIKAPGSIVVADRVTSRPPRRRACAAPPRPIPRLAYLVREALATRPTRAYLESCADSASVAHAEQLVQPYAHAASSAT
jgi:hypothetical protein